MEKQQAAAMYAEESFIAFDDKQESLATNNPFKSFVCFTQDMILKFAVTSFRRLHSGLCLP